MVAQRLCAINQDSRMVRGVAAVVVEEEKNQMLGVRSVHGRETTSKLVGG
jgi:hypothetical protein